MSIERSIDRKIDDRQTTIHDRKRDSSLSMADRLASTSLPSQPPKVLVQSGDASERQPLALYLQP